MSMTGSAKTLHAFLESMMRNAILKYSVWKNNLTLVFDHACVAQQYLSIDFHMTVTC